MLISVKHRFVLFLMPKCASTSLEDALREHCEFVIGGTPQLKHLSMKMYERHVERLLVRLVGKAEVFEKLCLFREPLDRLFSWYRYRTRDKLSGGERSTRDVSFSAFLNEYFAGRPARFARLRPQSSYIETNDGAHDAITLYRYEDVDALVAELTARLRNRLDWTHVNVSPHAAFDLSEPEATEARDKLRLEYSIYDSIPLRLPRRSGQEAAANRD